MTAVVARLASDEYAGRRVGTPGGRAAAAWLAEMLREAGADAILDEFPVRGCVREVYATMRTVDVTGTNVLGTFRTPRPGGLSVLLTAHYDGVGDDPDGVRFPAACDNASGVAAVVEAARVLHSTLPGDVGLSVALLDAEEAGAHGSAYHARFVAEGTFVVNLDGAAQLSDAAHVQAGGPALPLLAALDAAGREVGVPLKGSAMPSDNRRYAAAGLPAAGIGMGMPGYQTPAETPDRVEPETLERAVRLLVATVTGLV